MSNVGIKPALQQFVFNHPIISNYNSYSQKVFTDLSICHTSKKGMHYYSCDAADCGSVQVQYHSCGNRHCPNCGHHKREAWVEKQLSDLLATSYYHIVFTLPHELNSTIMGNRTVMFKLLFDSSAYTLSELSKDPKYLGATLGITSILHTWGQDLSFHPHIHCIVSGGGIGKDGTWVKEKRSNHRFLFPQAILQKIYKAYYLKSLNKLIKQGKLKIEDKDALDKTIESIGYKKWNVYAKAPFGGPEQVIKYLGRYTHKVAITTSRIKCVSNKEISFEYRDYANANELKNMTLSNEEFIRRYEQHILPKGFVKIRYYGYLKNYKKQERLDQLFVKMKLPKRLAKVYIPIRQRMIEKYGRDISKCPDCEQGTLILIATIRPKQNNIIKPGNTSSQNKAPPNID